MSSPEIQTVRNWQFTSFEGKDWKRRVGTTEWTEAESRPPADIPAMELKLVREEQISGEPNHWSLFLAREGEPGIIFQVRGDATAMSYAHEEDVNAVNSLDYKDSYIIAQPTTDQAMRIRYWATREVPPSAPNQAAVTENCQGWTIRVMEHLVSEGIVQRGWVDAARDLQEPVQ